MARPRTVRGPAFELAAASIGSSWAKSPDFGHFHSPSQLVSVPPNALQTRQAESRIYWTFGVIDTFGLVGVTTAAIRTGYKSPAKKARSKTSQQTLKSRQIPNGLGAITIRADNVAFGPMD
jgi:hypothetical protein